MMKTALESGLTFRRHAVTLLIFTLFFGGPIIAGSRFHLAIVFPGGPDSGEAGHAMVTEFAQTLADQAGLDEDSVSAHLFQTTDDAIAFLDQHPDAFIMGSLGFFLTHRLQFNLEPLATVGLPEGADERYYVLTKKGKFKNLRSLEGKTLSGSVLYESPRFLNAIVFDGKIDAAEFFSLKPTSRPLSAVRKVARDKIDAVLINQIQYHSLQQLPLFTQLDVLHTSSSLPPLGLMMTQTEKTDAVRDRVLNAILNLMASEEGKAACRTFGVDGFDKIPEGKLDEIIEAFDRF